MTELKSETRVCKDCEKEFLVTAQEQSFYQRKNLPWPNKCFDCRRERRKSLRNDRKLYERKCDKCKIDLQSTYPSDTTYIIYCEKCYLEQFT